MNDRDRILRVGALLTQIEEISVERFAEDVHRTKIRPHIDAILDQFLDSRS